MNCSPDKITATKTRFNETSESFKIKVNSIIDQWLDKKDVHPTEYAILWIK
jgi:hypothetical protein